MNTQEIVVNRSDMKSKVMLKVPTKSLKTKTTKEGKKIYH